MPEAPIFLTQDEIRDMTGRVRYKSQSLVLSALGIEHRVRPDGSLLVLRSHVELSLGGTTKTLTRQRVYEIDRSTL
ncbi:DUF4224 domain-containing protein [Pandoraea nosoerga]|uniref:DUF4224 domain-containing protein n=1 Tax=Pandoraea nosoerga TaxID=2508296 RepID=UPI00197EBCA0|nr:DUF4224 domain-containing protein [Pandoraea nosoerga]MBN4667180.1 DUF4224 domain-containing protein [Pandoraea nosoerga]MBN4677167.1 DUF4224 domain-containing protein [Pandoraea nosoerga]MBN4682012.1 DUF4224 domain-containing protein [Pandoraea nosoerga]MBN4746330.1 DUF4224 domain-containing protein [Pandoraea nosoerga]